jgi:DNA-binding phage protein
VGAYIDCEKCGTSDKALSSGGNPEFATVQKVVRSLGLKLHVTP